MECISVGRAREKTFKTEQKMQQLDEVFKMIFEVHKEYNLMLQPDAQETDEEWFEDVEHNLFAFK